jgi:hypothetical protein
VHVVFVASDDRDSDDNSLHGVAVRFSHSVAQSEETLVIKRYAPLRHCISCPT